MKVLGLTGPSGAGKGYVCALFADHGIPSIDCDAVYHALLVPPSACVEALAERFGKAILRADGSLDRKALGDRVFADPAELAALNAITHRFVLDRVREMLAELRAGQTPPPAVLVDAPALYESGFDAECDFVVAVLADRKTRASRIMARDHLTAEAAERRLAAQHPDDFYTAPARFTLYNDGDGSALEAQLAPVLTAIREGGSV